MTLLVAALNHALLRVNLALPGLFSLFLQLLQVVHRLNFCSVPLVAFIEFLNDNRFR